MAESKSLFRKTPILQICLLGIIFIINIRDIRELTSPCILFDEVGYWSSAALFTGNDWSEVMSTMTTYYAYGYGLVLSLILLITNSQTMAYQIAIVMNAVMICLSFLMNYYLLLKICNPKNKKIAMFVSFATQFYISVAFNSQIAWTEILLMFLFNLLIVVLYKTVVKNSFFFNIILAILGIYLFMVHMRTLGVLICLIAFRIFLFLIRKEKKKFIVCFFITLVFGLVLHYFMYNYVTDNIWNNFSAEIENLSQDVRGNNFSGQLGKIAFFFSFSGICTFLFLLVGRVFYLGISTFGLAFEGLYCIVKDIKNAVQKREYNEEGALISFFILITLVLTWCISSLFMIFRGRLDLIVYSRYTDWIIQPVLAFGWMHFLEKTCDNKFFKRYIYFTIFLLIYSLLFQKYADIYAGQAYFGSCAPYGFFFYRNGNVSTWIYYMAIYSCIIIGGYLFVKYFNKKSILIIFTIYICFSWVYLASYSLKPEYENACRQEVRKISDYISSEDQIYYVIAEGTREQQLIGAIQFCLKDRTIQCISDEEKNGLTDGIVIISCKDEQGNLFFRNDKMIITTKHYNIYRLE